MPYERAWKVSDRFPAVNSLSRPHLAPRIYTAQFFPGQWLPLSVSLSFPPFTSSLCLFLSPFLRFSVYIHISFSFPPLSFPPAVCLYFSLPSLSLSPLFSSFFPIISFSFLFLIPRSLTRLFPFAGIRFKSRRRANGRNARNRISPSLVRRTFARAVSRPRRATRDPAICFPSIDSERFSIYDRPNVIYPACSFRLARIHTCRTVETVRGEIAGNSRFISTSCNFSSTDQFD